MKVAEWMSADPQTVRLTDSVATARQLLSRYGIRHLPVVDADEVVGVVSDRDVRADRLDSPASERSVEGVMSSPPALVTADVPIQDAARLMLSRRISALPVVDEDRRLVGIVTTTDCLLALLEMSAETARG